MTARITPARRALGIAIVAIFAVLFTGATQGLSAQTQEGTTITNTATANFTDANGNTYSAESGSVTVTVAFQGALDATANATQSPLSPSVNNLLPYTITNGGNGTDDIQVNVTASDATVTNITGYRYVDSNGDTTTIAFVTDQATTLANLNTAIAADSVPYGGSVQVIVVYAVGSGVGDNTSNVTLTATSQRTGGDSDSVTTAVTPPTTGSVTVTSNLAAADRLPTSGETYSVTFQVANASTSAQLINLAASLDVTDAAGVTIVSVNGQAGSSSTGVSFNASETKTIAVVYTVANGSGTSTLTLSATGQTIGSGSDDHAVTGVQPVITVSKSVHASEANAQAGGPALSTNPQPGDTLWYRVAVTNTGTAAAVVAGTNDAATQMRVTDDLTGLPVTYVATSLNATGSPASWASLQITGNLITGTLTTLGYNSPTNLAYFVFAVVIN